jgi:predicted signal transduction protein with EAL and GGDEF domain
LSGVVRKSDTVARVGGDEFVVLAGDIAVDRDAEFIAKNALEMLQRPVDIRGVTIHTSASIGIVLYPTDGVNAETLLARADAAIYHAKKQGRNGFLRFLPSMMLGADECFRLENDLRSALTLDQMELYYQPKISAETGRLHSAEARIRWRHPQRGLVLPGEFFPLAEQSGLIFAIGECALREACRQAKRWQEGMGLG